MVALALVKFAAGIIRSSPMTLLRGRNLKATFRTVPTLTVGTYAIINVVPSASKSTSTAVMVVLPIVDATVFTTPLITPVASV